MRAPVWHTSFIIRLLYLVIASTLTVYAQTYEIQNLNSGKALDVTGGSSSQAFQNGTIIQQWDWLGGANQQWEVVPMQNGYYQIINAQSGKVLAVVNSSSNAGALIDQWDWLGSADQQWQIVSLGNGYNEIVNALSGKVLDVIGASTANGTQVQQYDWLGGANQQWQLITLSGNAGGIGGCSTGSPSLCIDPVPATNLSGTWIETNGNSEWTLTANNGNPSSQGTVSGDVIVFPPASENPGNCPVIHYYASGNFTPSSIVNGTEGTTSFTWTATNPDPNTECGGYTPVGSMTFNGTIINKSNDRGSGTWRRNDGISGTLNIEADTTIYPTGENLTNGGWNSYYPTELDVIQTITDSHSYDPSDPNGNLFQGRQAWESTPTPGNDGCYALAAAAGYAYPGGAFTGVTGSTWNVGAASGFSGNAYGYDTIGWPPEGVTLYRKYIPAAELPCSATFTQTMTIASTETGTGGWPYSNHTISVTIGSNYVTVQKDGVSSTTYR